MTTLDPVRLSELPLLCDLTPEVRELLVSSFERVGFAFGEVIVRQGEPADALYVIMSGRAQVVTFAHSGAEAVLRVLGPGDTLGADALIRRTARTATVRASCTVEAARLDGAVFRRWPPPSATLPAMWNSPRAGMR